MTDWARAIRLCSAPWSAGVDARVVVFAVDAGNVIERIVLRDREAEETVVEDIRAADRLAVIAQRRIRLPAVEGAGLGRVRASAGSGAFR